MKEIKISTDYLLYRLFQLGKGKQLAKYNEKTH